MKNQPLSSNINWKSIHAQANEVLGEDFWQDMAGLLPKNGPRIDVYQTEEEWWMSAELPGLYSAEQISLCVSGHGLVLRGELVRPFSVMDHQILRAERFFGPFECKVPFPAQSKLDFKEMTAHYYNGLLTVRIPLQQDQKETKIPIEFA
ncbi:Hsp20/alpha crystallin family protein [Paenibacillus larvae]|uniref:Heat shock protein n=4 Tax=Paenibacillus larvae TaxID=1464 RepID=V9WCH4_9BACL|nr:Hsp20/alpha crystallin family protein [Paenibacillus larvae]AHD07420.1 heat shock protein [Paenibacillus larvae subsp. larvae DSM 25430]AQR79122.1 hypothetical protein BXP28_19725 [Paenibacillus larvae subsp. larvae]AQT85470.1 hypothetical protein B1222_15380 [Paenibacillus larvae subsp. pulvifaciens]AQZ47478.1 hypothetical protein B5S25_13725 [Paenibacillus larvae subsp. pulvifaciens]ARF68784.1 hypothetical protein B7C51_14755 [Paenibacillus larvae subsp. pulvifaciens]